jgi:bifunctional non-homologous end joining protein LigD
VPVAGKELMPPRRLSVAISHPDKLYWPEDGYTKRDLVAFYDRVFEKLEPWVQGRLLSLERCPDGIAGECFYQKQAPAGLPPGTPTKAIRHQTGVTRYVVGGRRQTQLALANLGCIAVHVWGSRAAAPRKPDWVCFDLDPESGKFADAAKAGLKLRKALDALGLASYPKTSGGRGLHVFVPIRVGPDADDALSFARQIGSALARSHPDELTVEARIAKRGGRVYLDAARNGFAQTVAAPYSVRARPHAPVSTPLDWSEVRPSLDPARFHLGNFARRLDQEDPWADFWKRRQALPV